MKNLLNATLPALALLALGGCATTGAISSTEDDGVYYSLKDRTTAVAPTPARGYAQGTQGRNAYDGFSSAPTSAQVTTPGAENTNPDYQGGTQTTATGTDYYDDSYVSTDPSQFGQTYTGPGVSTYNYTPSWSVAPAVYGSPFGYGAGLSMAYGYGGFSPYNSFGYGGLGGFGGYPYGGFYDPFYSPFGYGYGSGLSIGFGYGFGRFGGFGYPYGGFGRFGYPYSPYAYGGYGYPYGGGYYGDAYYNRGAYYNRPVVYANGTRSGSGDNPTLVGPRGGRGGNVVNGAVGGAGVNSNMVNIGGGRRGSAVTGGLVAPGGNPNGMQPANAGVPQTYGRGAGRGSSFGGGAMVGQPAAPAGVAGAQPAGANMAMPDQAAGRRGGFFREVFGSGNANAGNAGATNAGDPQMQQRRSYSQPSRPDYQQQQRSYSQPQRSFEQRTFSQPAPERSFGGGNMGGGGGGSFGGGSVGGGGGGRRR